MLTPEEHDLLALMRKRQSEGGMTWTWADARALDVLEQCLKDKPPGMSPTDYETYLHLRKKHFVYRLELDAGEMLESYRVELQAWAWNKAAHRKLAAEAPTQQGARYVPLNKR